MRYVIAALCLSIAACSTTPVARDEAASSEIHWAETQIARDGTGTLTITRDSGLYGAACRHTVTINGTRAATMRPGTTASFHLDPGEYLVLVEFGRGLCPNVALSQDVQIVVGQTRSYRVLLPSDGAARLVRVE